ncbi:MAG TPA: response regulator [Flavisolibacter sp.]|nr:response regulator [Flavisolibacter sp.]
MCALYKEIPNRILIIDDDVDLLMLLERRLEREGYHIETAASLPEAEEVLSSFKPHLVLLDINVKGQDGRKLCWKLKMSQDDPPVKVIIMSGYDYSRGRAALFGADDLLPKPLNVDYLLHLLSLYLFSTGEGNTVMPEDSEIRRSMNSFWHQLKSKLVSIGDASS